jgi:hypothetical protein
MLGAVSIAARMIAVPGLIAVCAVVEMAAQHLGSTLLDGAHGGQMAGQHASAILVSIGGSIVTQDIGQFYHVISAMVRLMASAAAVSVGRVRWR